MTLVPHDKFINRWAEIFMERHAEGGSAAAERWAARSLNRRDYPRIKERILVLRGIEPS